jgi:hypothetical protein
MKTETEFKIKVVKTTNELIQSRLTRGIDEMTGGWCVPFATHLEQAIIDSKYFVRHKIESIDEKELWESVMVSLNEIITHDFSYAK